MRILDELGNELTEYDEYSGYLREEKIFLRHHEAVPAADEVGHYEVVAEYPNGGKDVKWVVDVKGVEAQEAYDEYENILRFVAYTEAEAASVRIGLLKQKLSETDYAVVKIAEGAATAEYYADIIAQRVAWRAEINDLEKMVD